MGRIWASCFLDPVGNSSWWKVGVRRHSFVVRGHSRMQIKGWNLDILPLGLVWAPKLCCFTSGMGCGDGILRSLCTGKI